MGGREDGGVRGRSREIKEVRPESVGFLWEVHRVHRRWGGGPEVASRDWAGAVVVEPRREAGG